MYVYVYIYTNVTTGAEGIQKRAFDILELELQVVVNFPECILGTKFMFSTRTASILAIELSL